MLALWAVVRHMNRRNFLRALVAAAGSGFDPERLLWVPGRRKIFLPPNRFLTFDIISRDALRILEKSLAFQRVHNRYLSEWVETYEAESKIGDVIRVRLPRRFVA